MIFLAKNPLLIQKYSRLSVERVKLFDLNNIKKEWVSLIETTLSHYYFNKRKL